jgi:hypothetical protein
MKIQKDKTYAVNPPKYGFKEVEDWVCDSKKVVLTTIWKRGTINITPRTDDEVNLLQTALANGENDSFRPYDYSDTEFAASFDGYVEDVDYIGWTEDEELDGTIDEVWEGVDLDGVSYLEENGYYCDESMVVFEGQLSVEEV